MLTYIFNLGHFVIFTLCFGFLFVFVTLFFTDQGLWYPLLTDQVIACCIDLVESSENSRLQTLAASALWALAYNNHKVSPSLLWMFFCTLVSLDSILNTFE